MTRGLVRCGYAAAHGGKPPAYRHRSPKNSGGYAPASPPDPINIHQQWFIIQNVSRPTSDTRPTIFFSLFGQIGTHRILMSVMNSLHQHVFCKQQSRIRMVIPQGMTIAPRSYLVTQFLQPDFVVVFFQIADYAAAGYAVDELKRSRRRQTMIRD
jgi:hypothetical protein